MQAIGPHDSLRDAREAGMNVLGQRDEIIDVCLPYATRLARKMIKLPSLSRCEFEDIEASAILGLIEGVDSFNPRKGVHIQTHLWYRIRKRMNDERDAGHWAIMKPPKELAADYMMGRLSAKEVEAYLDLFVRPHDVPGEDRIGWSDAIFDGVPRGGSL